jgi:hypothetical protein
MMVVLLMLPDVLVVWCYTECDLLELDLCGQ